MEWETDEWEKFTKTLDSGIVHIDHNPNFREAHRMIRILDAHGVLAAAIIAFRRAHCHFLRPFPVQYLFPPRHIGYEEEMAIAQVTKQTTRNPGSAMAATNPKDRLKNASNPPISPINMMTTEGSGFALFSMPIAFLAGRTVASLVSGMRS